MSEPITILMPEVIGAGYKAFWNNRSRYRVLKGGRASKKSITTAIWFIYNIMKYPLANALVVRDTFNTHKDSTFAALKWAAIRLGVYHHWRFTHSPLEATFLPTGQKILFRGFDDPMKLTSITVSTGVLCWVWIEEAFEIKDEKDFQMLDESIRGTMPEGYWKQFTLTYNPWINAHWTKARFFDNADPQAFTLTTTYKCNEFIDDADRDKIESLRDTNPSRYRVVGLGEYGFPGEIYFDMFGEEIHVCEPFDIPEDWEIIAGMDYGNTTIAEFVTRNPKTDVMYVVNEWEVKKELGKPAPEGTEKARKYRLFLEKHYSRRQSGRQKIRTLGDTNMFARFGEYGADVPASAEYFEREKIEIEKVAKKGLENDKFRWSYNELVKDLLFWRKDVNGLFTVRPKLYIFKTCKTLISTLPQLQTDPKDPRDFLSDEDNDHGFDAMKYALTYFTGKIKREGKGKLIDQKLIAEILKRNALKRTV